MDPRQEETIRLIYDSLRERKGVEQADLFLNRVTSLLEDYEEGSGKAA